MRVSAQSAPLNSDDDDDERPLALVDDDSDDDVVATEVRWPSGGARSSTDQMGGAGATTDADEDENEEEEDEDAEEIGRLVDKFLYSPPRLPDHLKTTTLGGAPRAFGFVTAYMEDGERVARRDNPKWVPMSAKKVREMAKMTGKAEVKARPKEEKKEKEVDGRVRVAWNDTFSSDQPLSEEASTDQYAEWCAEGKPGADAVEVSFLPSKVYRGSKTDEVGIGYYRNGVKYLSLEKQVTTMRGVKPPHA